MKFRNTEPYPLLFRKYSLKKQCFLVLPLCHICPFRLKLINDINDMRYSQADIVDIERVLLTIWAPTIENEVIEVLIRNGDALPRPISQSCVTNRTEVAAGIRKFLPKNVTKKNRMWRTVRRSRRSWKACPILMWGRASRCWRYDDDSTDDDDADDDDG